MQSLLRPLKSMKVLMPMVLGAGILISASAAGAQSRDLIQLVQEPGPFLIHSGSQGYLGVDLGDVDQEKALSLKLKDVRGAVITLIDHDAPAGQIGLRVNDVVLSLNGQTVEGADQLRRMLREIPAHRKVSLVISRDGNTQTLNVELADRKAMEQEAWNRLNNSGSSGSGPTMGILSGGDGSLPSGFRMPSFGSSLNVGALVEPLTSQMAEYLGVQSGLMIKQVARKSEAAAAGLKAFDVILKVGPDSITTISDWDRALRSNQGKPVQVTILRDRKQQTLTLQVDSKHRGEWKIEDLFPQGDCPLVAALDGDEMAGLIANQTPAAAQELRNRSQALKDELAMGNFGLSAEQEAEIRRQAEALGNFKIDAKQMEQFRRQLDEMRKSLEMQFQMREL